MENKGLINNSYIVRDILPVVPKLFTTQYTCLLNTLMLSLEVCGDYLESVVSSDDI